LDSASGPDSDPSSSGSALCLPDAIGSKSPKSGAVSGIAMPPMATLWCPRTRSPGSYTRHSCDDSCDSGWSWDIVNYQQQFSSTSISEGRRTAANMRKWGYPVGPRVKPGWEFYIISHKPALLGNTALTIAGIAVDAPKTRRRLAPRVFPLAPTRRAAAPFEIDVLRNCAYRQNYYQDLTVSLLGYPPRV